MNNGTEYKLGIPELHALIHTTERAVDELKSNNYTKADIVNVVTTSCNILRKQIDDSLEHNHINESQKLELNKRLGELERRFGYDNQSIGQEVIEAEKIYEKELEEAKSMGMNEEVISFVMKREMPFGLNPPDTENNRKLWKEIGRIREGQLQYPSESITINPGLDLGQEKPDFVRTILSGVLKKNNTDRIVALGELCYKYSNNNTSNPENKGLQKIPNDFSDIKSIEMSPAQIKTIGIRLYKNKYWKYLLEKMPSIKNAPTGVRAAFLSKFVHRGTGWVKENLSFFAREEDQKLGIDKKSSFSLSQGLRDALSKTPPNWYDPRLIYLFGQGPLKDRSNIEQAMYIKDASPGEKEQFTTWMIGYNKLRTPKPTSIEKNSKDPQKIIEEAISYYRTNGTKRSKGERWLPSEKTEKAAFSVYDLRDDKMLANIEDSVEMRAASMIKPFVALAYLIQHPNVGKEELTKIQYVIDYNPEPVRNTEWYKKLPGYGKYQKANALTTELMKSVGGPSGVQRILDQNLPPDCANGIKVRETLKTSGQTYQNTLTTRAVMEFYKYLYAKREVTPYGTLLELLRTPKHDTIVDMSPKGTIPPEYNTTVASKSGYTGMSRGDGGIIFAKDKDGKEHPYIFVGMFSRGDANNGNVENVSKFNGGEGSMRSSMLGRISGKVYQSIFEKK